MNQQIPLKSYLNLRVHKKPFIPLLKECRKLKSLDKIYPFLYSVLTKRRIVSQKFKYPIKCAKTLIDILANSEKSVKSEFKYKKLRLVDIWVNKGASRGVRGIPRARGQTSPKYLPSMHMYLRLDNDEQ